MLLRPPRTTRTVTRCPYTTLFRSSATGRGVWLQERRQARNEFLDQTYRRQNSKCSYWLQKSSTLMQMEQTLGDFNSGSEAHTGLQQSVQDFTNAWEIGRAHV